jgi:flagellar hook-length control protein FliK
VRTAGQPPESNPFSHMLRAAVAPAKLGATTEAEAGAGSSAESTGFTEVLDPLAVAPGDPSAEAVALVQLLPPPLPPPPAPVPEPSSTSLMQWVMQLSPPPELAASIASAATETAAGTATLRPDVLARSPTTAAAGAATFTLPSDVPRTTPGGHASEVAASGMTDLPFSFIGVAAAAVAVPPTGVVMAQGSPVVAPAQTWIQTPVTQPGFSDAVVVELVRRVGQAEQGVQSVTLHLNPEALGPVSVSIELNGNAARIEFGASEALTRHHLEAALPGLTEALRHEGVSLTHSGVHEASKEALAANATEGQASGGAGSDPQQRGEALFDGRSGHGEHAPRRATAVFAVDGHTVTSTHVPTSLGPAPGRAGRLDLFA